MIHEYQVTGMTCSSCVAKVQSAILKVPHISSVVISKEEKKATITMSEHVALESLQTALDARYSITELKPAIFANPVSTYPTDSLTEEKKSWWETYKPVLMVFFYITAITLLVQFSNGSFSWMQGMQHFMAGFFLVFSFFKLLNLEGFADSYRMYDLIAKKFKQWPYWYAFIELGLGLAFLVNFNPLMTNLITFIVMSVSVVGVLQSVLNKRKIKCACLGAVFNLPMSTITIIEDFLMIVMSAIMIFIHFVN